jgi:hypothetical protein
VNIIELAPNKICWCLLVRVRFEVVSVVTIEITGFCNVKSYCFVDRGSRFLRNVDTHAVNDMV